MRIILYMHCFLVRVTLWKGRLRAVKFLKHAAGASPGKILCHSVPEWGGHG